MLIEQGVAESLGNIESVLESMCEEEGSFAHQCASAYRGLFIDQFTCEEETFAIVDAVGGLRL